MSHPPALIAAPVAMLIGAILFLEEHRGASTMDPEATPDLETFPCPLDPGAAVDALAAHFGAADLGLIHYLLSQVDAVERESRRLRRRLEATGESTRGDETLFDTET